MDGNAEKYGIKDYMIRNSTLEEVFITLGELEKKAEGENEEKSEEIEDFVPDLEEPTFGRLFKANFNFQYTSAFWSGLVCSLVLGILLAGISVGMVYFSMINLNKPLDYSDMASIYDRVTPMELQYNILAGTDPE